MTFSVSTRTLEDEAIVHLQNTQEQIPALEEILISQKTQTLICVLYNLSRNNYKLSLKHS